VIYSLTIPGDPVAQQRPRFSRRSGRAYDPQHDLKNSLTYHIASQWKDPPLEGPIQCNMTFYCKIPASTSAKKRAAMELRPCLKHKDLDNFIKLFSDCMNGIVFVDDCQIWKIQARKEWSSEPRTEMTILVD
jgi:Holliday junction resolvase RusA-like endonuclease